MGLLAGENLLSASCTADAIAAADGSPTGDPCASAPRPVDLLLGCRLVAVSFLRQLSEEHCELRVKTMSSKKEV